MGNLAADERIVSVDEALSLRPVCGPCARPASFFAGRTIQAGSNGFTSAGQVEDRIAFERASGIDDPESMLQAMAQGYEEYLGYIMGLEGER